MSEEKEFYVCRVILGIIFLLYNFAILSGTAYLVFYKEINPWWFLLAFLVLIRK